MCRIDFSGRGDGTRRGDLFLLRSLDQGTQDCMLDRRCFACIAITDMANRIPKFPEFKHLNLEDHAEFDQFTRQYPPYSEFNFVNLFCYDTAGDCQVSILNGNLVVRFRDYVTGEPFFSFLGCDRVIDTVDSLIALSSKQGFSPALQLIPECSIRGALDGFGGGEGGEILISVDPDNADYIIDAHSLIALESRRWRNKREAANKFKRRHPHHLLQQIDIHDAHTQEQVKRLFQTWAKKRHKTTHETQNELKAIGRLLCHSKNFELVSLGAFLDGRLEGFTINEVVHHGYYMGHFGKTNPDYSGLSVVLESETARIMVSLGCRYMNYQQDLGLDGLRRHKSSWHPTAHLRKFTLHQATDRPIRKVVLK